MMDRSVSRLKLRRMSSKYRQHYRSAVVEIWLHLDLKAMLRSGSGKIRHACHDYIVNEEPE